LKTKTAARTVVAEPKPESYEFVPLGNTYRVLPDALRELEAFSFWGLPRAKKDKQPGHWNGSKWIFTEWQKVENLACISDALRLSRDLRVNIGLVVPDCWVMADFDHCRDPVTGYIHPTVQRIIERLKTVVLLSSSGTGLHVILKYTPDQLLPDKTRFTNPDLYLDIFEDKKKGELKKPGTFVAINWHPLHGYNALDKTVQQFPEWLEAELFIREETVPSAEPSAQPPRPRPVSTPQVRAPRESEPEESPFGIKWKPEYQAHVKAVFNGFDDPREGSDISTSGGCYQWIGLYITGAEHWTYDGAVDLSKRVEGLLRKKQPQRKNKPDSWHEKNVIKLIRTFTKSGSLIYRSSHDREGRTPVDEQQLQALKYAQGTYMKPATQKIFLMIVSLAKGRDRFKLRDADIAKASSVHRDTVIQAKKELTSGSFLKIKGNIYTFL
jgi:hypothetical protein